METIEPGFMLNHFRIEHQLGAGGMGSVYCGTDTTLDRPVAIKILDDRLKAVPENRERFQREARIIAALRHPNLMQIYYVGEDKGLQYFVMEYIRGVSLQGLLVQQGGKLPLKEALRIFIEIISALRKVHNHGIIHRDLKPANVMIDADDGRAILVDFGLSKECEETAGLTSDGAILGTPDYMSPEQIEGGDLGPHTDIYSLGVILYQMLSGISPFRRKTTIQTLRAHCESAPPPITAHDPNLPPALALIINTMLAKTADQRYKSIEELAAALYTVCKHPALSRMIGAGESLSEAKTAMTPASALRKASVQMRAPGEIPTAPAPQGQPAPGKIIVANRPATAAAPAGPVFAQPAKPVVVAQRANVQQPSMRAQTYAQAVQHPVPPMAVAPGTAMLAAQANRRLKAVLIPAGILLLGVIVFLLTSGILSSVRNSSAAPAKQTGGAPASMAPAFSAGSAQPATAAQPTVATPTPVVASTTPAESPAPAASQPATVPLPDLPPLPVVDYIPPGAATASTGIPAPDVIVFLKEGGSLNGKLEGADAATIRLRLNPSVVNDFPLDQIRGIVSRESKRLENLLPEKGQREPFFNNILRSALRHAAERAQERNPDRLEPPQPNPQRPTASDSPRRP